MRRRRYIEHEGKKDGDIERAKERARERTREGLKKELAGRKQSSKTSGFATRTQVVPSRT